MNRFTGSRTTWGPSVISMVGVLILAGTAIAAGDEPAHTNPVPSTRSGERPADRNVDTPAPFAPYAFLIGEWDVGPQGGKTGDVSRFRWGPGKTYIWYSGAYLVDGGEQPAWEGPLVWNGVRGRLDFLLVLEPSPGHLVQEQGTIHLEPDGTVVREITAYYSEGNPAPPDWAKAGPGGATARYRHTFKADGPDRILTTVMRETEDGWSPSFPGSDHLVMTRRT